MYKPHSNLNRIMKSYYSHIHTAEKYHHISVMSQVVIVVSEL